MVQRRVWPESIIKTAQKSVGVSKFRGRIYVCSHNYVSKVLKLDFYLLFFKKKDNNDSESTSCHHTSSRWMHVTCFQQWQEPVTKYKQWNETITLLSLIKCLKVLILSWRLNLSVLRCCTLDWNYNWHLSWSFEIRELFSSCSDQNVTRLSEQGAKRKSHSMFSCTRCVPKHPVHN